ncbi:MAG TPA: hypothetical protein VJ201_08310 [Candidatus Babeliales bacterium]|nr:hypothetical protein [Candidatus Babeliales bacterium]
MSFFSRPSSILCIAISTDNMVLSFIDRNLWLANFGHHCQLQAYRRIKLENNEFYESHIFNYQLLINYILQFVYDFKIKHPSVVVSVDGPSILEQLVYHNIENENGESKSLWCDKTKNNWQRYYLGNCHCIDNVEVYYQCSIPHGNLLQYHLLILMAQMRLIHLTTHTFAQLRALIYRNGLIKIALSPDDEKNSLHSYLDEGIKTYDVTHHMKISRDIDIDIVNEKNYLIASFGLYLLGNQANEKFS